MDAPLYPPAKAFVAPIRLPRVLTSADTPVAVLRGNPAAWTVVTTLIPGLAGRIGSEAIKPHLTNFSLRTLVQFGVIPADQLPAIDARLSALGAVR